MYFHCGKIMNTKVILFKIRKLPSFMSTKIWPPNLYPS